MRLVDIHQFNTSLKHKNRRASLGFTLVEMLVAMAVTLLMMVALARSFAYVGRQVQESRAVTQLTSELRDVTTRLHSDLKQCTVRIAATGDLASDQNGYFLYYEGPLTDATSSLFRIDTSSGQPVFPDSRYGDCDDYLAFTAVAKPGQWFKGKVPRYLILQKEREVFRQSLTDPTLDPGPYVLPADTNDPAYDSVVIESKYAEIVYFASPEYVSGTNTYIDNDGTIDFNANSVIDGEESRNGFPDRLRIHRRVLLIRPDLNITTSGRSNLGVMAAGSDPVIGLAETVHQQCDLSVRRILQDRGLPAPNAIAANSLTDLSKPHNRFAHYRILGATGTSMPLLALGPAATILSDVALTNGTDMLHTSNESYVTPSVNGFLRPEFVLTGTRLGEDVCADYVTGFDVQIFDPEAHFYVTSAEAVGPGDAGYRDALQTTSSISSYQGGFVDLCYPVLQGGTVRGWNATPSDMRGIGNYAAVGVGAGGRLASRYAGGSPIYSIGPGGTPTGVVGWNLSPSFQRSGRVGVYGTNKVFQPVFDTYSSHYERDGYLQQLTANGMFWRTDNPSASTVDLGANGLDDDGTYGADDLGERETLPPFTGEANSVRVSVRLENSKIRLVRQASVEYANP